MKPQKEIRDAEYEKLSQRLFQTFITFADSYQAEKFLKEILTDSEFIMLKRRWHIACLLNSGYNDREAAEKTGASTQTVQAVKRTLLNSQIFKDYLPRINKPEQEPGKLNTLSTSKSSPKYIFG